MTECCNALDEFVETVSGFNRTKNGHRSSYWWVLDSSFNHVFKDIREGTLDRNDKTRDDTNLWKAPLLRRGEFIKLDMGGYPKKIIFKFGNDCQVFNYDFLRLIMQITPCFALAEISIPCSEPNPKRIKACAILSGEKRIGFIAPITPDDI